MGLGNRDAGQLQAPPRSHADPLDMQRGAETLAKFLLNPRLCPARLHIQIHADQNEERHAHDHAESDEQNAAHFFHARKLRRRAFKKRLKPTATASF